MTKSFCHFDTIPSDLMDIIEADLSEKFDPQMDTSKLMGNQVHLEKRNSRNAWIPTSHWLGGLMWYYFNKANKEFFHYDLECIDGESMQYTHYKLNQHYDWHQDEGIASYYKPQASGNRGDERRVQDFINEKAERVRKLSCSLQLSHEEDYEGGGTQVLDVDNTMVTFPKGRGSLFFFDSRLAHRAKTVHKGLRKSLICWAIGPRWK